MISKGTGHATAPAAGDYVLSFTANMVSSNSQVLIMIMMMPLVMRMIMMTAMMGLLIMMNLRRSGALSTNRVPEMRDGRFAKISSS